jgi:hypothetical protein
MEVLSPQATPEIANERTGQEVPHVSHGGYVPLVGLRRSPQRHAVGCFTVPQLPHASNKAAKPSLVATSLVPHPIARWRENVRLHRRHERGLRMYARVGQHI